MFGSKKAVKWTNGTLEKFRLSKFFFFHNVSSAFKLKAIHALPANERNCKKCEGMILTKQHMWFIYFPVNLSLPFRYGTCNIWGIKPSFSRPSNLHKWVTVAPVCNCCLTYDFSLRVLMHALPCIYAGCLVLAYTETVCSAVHLINPNT